ncbi:hypothetical protein ACP4OV_019258 [Aristida adscensionis]
MAPALHHLRLRLAVSLLLLIAGLAACATAAAEDSSEEQQLRIKVRHASAEEAAWLDRWADKYQQAEHGSGSGGFSVQPASDDESAVLNRMFSDAMKGAGKSRRRAGFDGHIEFDGNHPFGRVVVDTVQNDGEHAENEQEKSGVEKDNQDL